MALAGIFGASFAIIDVLSSPSGGFISDTFGRKRSLVIALAGAAGCVFAMVPLIRRRLTGQIAGMVGAYGNIGAVLFLTVFSFVTPSVFFLTIACGIVFAAFASLYLDEPKGAMAEIMPDGTVQMIDVH